jgi:hypothetical protein
MTEQRIWKYPLELASEQALLLPANARILCVQVQDGTPCTWALVTPGMAVEQRTFLTYGTGQPGAHGDYVGTYQLHDGGLVLHVFEEVVTPL